MDHSANSLHHRFGGWKDASHGAPCPICGKHDWCRISADQQWVACRREARGATKVKPDKNGADVYLHCVGHVSHSQGFLADNVHAHGQAEGLNRQASSVKRANSATLDKVYRALLDQLKLSDGHREAIKRRGLSDEAIAERGYRSHPRSGRVEIAKKLHAEFAQDLVSVPGFVDASGFPKLVGSSGLLVPVRNPEGLIVALKVRRDGAAAGNKYFYLSSTKYGGPGPGAPVHIPSGISGPTPTVRLTEGELKADIATGISGLPTISIPGATNWRPAIEVIRALGAKTVRLALDADALTNPVVAKALFSCSERLIAERFVIELERWEPTIGKGIDDVLAAGETPEVLVGEDAVQAIKEIARAAGVEIPVIRASELGAQLQSALNEEGPAGLFGNHDLLESLAKVAITDPAQFAIHRDSLRGTDVKLRDLDRVLRPLQTSLRAENPSSATVETEKYFVSEDGCICRQKKTFDGLVNVVLANFGARIVEQVTHDDGAEQRIVLAIEGKLAGGRPLPRVDVLAEEFVGMNWPLSSWGTQSVVSAGASAKDHLRAAIQTLSGNVPRRQIYGHTGWRNIDGAWCYLHGGGAIGPNGAMPGIMVALPEDLAGYDLPEQLSAAGAAVRASLGILEVGPMRITVPLLAAVYRAVLGNSDHGLHLAGPTGVFKTELVALAQQHFGPAMDARHIPGSWASTGNALEATAFAAKDAILVVDDFAPTGSSADVQRLHREADRLLRAQGNHSGRQRMRPDGGLRPTKPPRGLIVSTGEDVPRGQSLRARLLILEIAASDIDRQRLTQCQANARQGLYAAALAGFVCWLAPRYESVRNGLRAEINRLRDSAIGGEQHARTPGIVADLAVGLKYFLEFAIEAGALSREHSLVVWNQSWDAIRQAAHEQASHQIAAEPTAYFLRLLAGTLASGRAHVAAPNGECPDVAPEAWGWRLQPGKGDSDLPTWIPQGRRIGWRDGEDDLLLEPEASFAEAQRLAGEQGENIGITPRTMWKRLREKELLRSVDEKRTTNTIRRTLEGQRREVLHFHSAYITGDNPTKLTVESSGEENAEESGQFAGQVAGEFSKGAPQNLTKKTAQLAYTNGSLGSLVGSYALGKGLAESISNSPCNRFVEGDL